MYLNDHYSDYDQHSSVEETPSEGWSDVLLIRKKSKLSVKDYQMINRSSCPTADDIYGQKASREKLRLNNPNQHNDLTRKSLKEIVFDSNAQLLEKRSEIGIERDFYMQEARQKRDQVVFKTDGLTIVQEEAPGLHVRKTQNKRYRRTVAAKPEPPAMKKNKVINESVQKPASTYEVGHTTIETTEQSKMMSINTSGSFE